MKIIPKGTKIYVSCHVGYAGMDGHEFFELDEDYTEDRLNDIIYDIAVDHASSYGIYPASDYDMDEIPEEEQDQYSDNIEAYFEIYDPEQHDMYSIGGVPVFSKL